MSIFLTLGEAAREVSVSKSTLHRAIKDGRLSANRDEHGHYEIDPAELFRVFEPTARKPIEETAEYSVKSAGEGSDSVRWFQKEITELKQENEELQQRNAELREAMKALPSPEQHQAEFERLKKKSQERLERQKQAYAKIMGQQKTAQAKDLAEKNQEIEHWKIELERRQQEVEAARAEAEQLSAKAEAERIAREALEKRGWWERLLNRRPEITA